MSLHDASTGEPIEEFFRRIARDLAREIAREVVRELPAALQEELVSGGWLQRDSTPNASADEDEPEDEGVTAIRAQMRRALGVDLAGAEPEAQRKRDREMQRAEDAAYIYGHDAPPTARKRKRPRAE